MIDELLNMTDPVASTDLLINPRLTMQQLQQLGFRDASGADTGLRLSLQRAQLNAQNLVNWYNRTLTANFNMATVTTTQMDQFAFDTGIGFNEITNNNDYSVTRSFMQRIVVWQQIRQLATPFVGNANANQLLDTTLDPQNPPNGTLGQRLTTLLTQVGMTRAGFNPYLVRPIWAEALNSFQAVAIRQEPQVENLLFGNNGIFSVQERFAWVSDAVFYRQVQLYLNRYPNESEQDIAARIALYHNSGREPTNLADVYYETNPSTRQRQRNQYVWNAVANWSQGQCSTLTVNGIQLNDNMSP